MLDGIRYLWAFALDADLDHDRAIERAREDDDTPDVTVHENQPEALDESDNTPPAWQKEGAM